MAVKTTFKERLEIVQYTLAHDKDYQKRSISIKSHTLKSILGSENLKKMAKLPFKISVERPLKIVNSKLYPKLNALNRDLTLKERNEYLETENIILKKKDRTFCSGKRCCHVVDSGSPAYLSYYCSLCCL